MQKVKTVLYKDMPINLLKGRLVTYFKSQFNGENWVLETNYRDRNIFFSL